MTTASEIAARLADKALTVAQLLFPHGKAENNYWHATEDENDFVITVEGDQKGLWINLCNQQSGDLVDLWRVKASLRLFFLPNNG